MKVDILWHHVFYTLDDLYNNYCYNDEMFKDMLHDLINYVDKKITPSDDAGEMVNKYVVIEYEENKSILGIVGERRK